MNKLNELKLSDEMIRRYDSLYNSITELAKKNDKGWNDFVPAVLLNSYVGFIGNIPLVDLDQESLEEFEKGIIKFQDRVNLGMKLNWCKKNGNDEEAKKIANNLDNNPNLDYFNIDSEPITLEVLKNNLDFIKSYFSF